MNNGSVEKMLREKAAQLPKAEFDLNAPILYQSINKISMKKGKAIRPIFRVALATLSVVILTFSVCFIVSAEFRNTTMSLFRATSPEIIRKIPAKNNVIQLVGKQNIDNIADVFYYNLGGNSLSDNIVTLKQPDGSNKFYTIKEGDATEITPITTRITDTVEFDGRILNLDFEYGTLNDKPYLKNITSNDPYYFYSKDMIWVRVSTGQQSQYSDYYILYNLNNGEIIDILADAIPKKTHIETIVFSPDKHKLILYEFNGGWPGKSTYFDAATRTATNLSTLTGIDKIYGCNFIDDDLLFIEQYHNESLLEHMDFILSGCSYNLKTGKKITLFETDDTVIVGRYGNYVLEKDGVSRIVTPVGDVYPIEGIDLSTGYDFMMNRDHTKIAFFKYERQLGISEIGIIDLVKKEIKTFERKGYEKIGETCVGWNDNNSLVVTASDGAFYLYRFK